MAKKEKKQKIKGQGLANVAGTLSVINGAFCLTATLIMFFIFFLWGDELIQKMFGIQEGLLVVLFVFIIVITIFILILKLFVGGVMLIHLIVGAIMSFIAGKMMKSASANIGNIYSNKKNRSRAITSMIMWFVQLAFLGVGIFIVAKVEATTSLSFNAFKIANYVCIAVSAVLTIICFVITLVDYIRKIRQVKRDENGLIIDETIIKLVENKTEITQEQPIIDEIKEESLVQCVACGSKIDKMVSFCPNCGHKNEQKENSVPNEENK